VFLLTRTRVSNRYLYERGKRTLYVHSSSATGAYDLCAATRCGAHTSPARRVYVRARLFSRGSAHGALLCARARIVAGRMDPREAARKDICAGRCLKRAVEDSLDFFRDLSLSLSLSLFLSPRSFPPHCSTQLSALFRLMLVNIARFPTPYQVHELARRLV